MKCISQWDEQPGFQAQSHTAALNQCCQFGGKTQHFSVLICHCGNPETDCGDRVNPPGRSPCQPRHHFIGNHSKSPLCGHKLDALRRLPAHPSLRPELRSPQLRSARSAGADAAPGAGNATADRSRLPAADTRLPTPVLALRPDGSSQSPLRCCRSPPPSSLPPRPAAPPPRPVPGLGTGSPKPSTAASPTGNRGTGARRDYPRLAAPPSSTACGRPRPQPRRGRPPVRAPGRHTTQTPTRCGGAQPNPPLGHTAAAPDPHLARLGRATGRDRRAALLRSGSGSGGA